MAKVLHVLFINNFGSWYKIAMFGPGFFLLVQFYIKQNKVIMFFKKNETHLILQFMPIQILLLGPNQLNILTIPNF